MIEEIWKPTLGGYEASNLGRIRSLDRRVIGGYGKPRNQYGKILKTPTNSCGYPCVNLSLGNKNKRKYIGVHSLVAVAFLGARPSGKEVNHIDGNKKNSNIKNLEYITRSENNIHINALTGCRRGENNWNRKLTERAVAAIRSNRKESSERLGHFYGVSRRTISDIMNKKTWAWLA